MCLMWCPGTLRPASLVVRILRRALPACCLEAQGNRRVELGGGGGGLLH